MKKAILILSALIIIFFTGQAHAITNIYGATCRTGAAACVDGIDVGDADGNGTDLTAGDICVVVMDAGSTEPEFYVYRLYDSGTAESDPNVIKPDYVDTEAYSGDFRWHLVNLYGKSINSTASPTPSMSFYDSDCTDDDVNVKIYTDCTDTGSGTEDCDIKIAVQIAGAMTDVVSIDADGPITFILPVAFPATLSSAAAVTWTLMDNQASGLSFGASGATDILKIGTLDTGAIVTVGGTLAIGANNFTSSGYIMMGADPADSGIIRLSAGDAIAWEGTTEVLLTNVPQVGLLLNSTMQLQFGDSGTYIAQLTDGHLDLTADVSIDLNGAVSAGAGGFSIDADGDVIGKSFTTTKVNGTAGTNLLYEANSTDINGVGWKGPASRSSDLYLAFSDADPVINQFMLFPAPTTGTSTAAWQTYGTFTGLAVILPSSDADPASAAGALRHDSVVTNFTGGAMRYYNGAAIKQLVDMTAATAEACTDTQVVAYNSTSDLWYCKDDANSGSATAWDDIGDPDAAGTIAFAGYQQIISSTLNSAGSVLTMTNTTADLTADVSFIDMKYTDDGDANGFFLRGYDNSGNDLKWSIAADGAATFGTVGATTFTGNLTGNASGSAATLTGTLANVAASTSANLATCLSDEQGAGVAVFSDSPTFVDDITIAAAGVKLTGANGALTILGLGDGQDEDVKIDLNTTANTIIVSSPASSATTLSISALNLVTTGTLQSGIVINSDANGMSAAEMTTVGVRGTLFIATGAGTWILPTAVSGMSVCVMDSGTSHDLIVDVTANDYIILKGTTLVQNAGITNAATATTGDFVCLVATAAGYWSTMGMSGAWVTQ